MPTKNIWSDMHGKSAVRTSMQVQRIGNRINVRLDVLSSMRVGDDGAGAIFSTSDDS